tara:strand:+ start:234 stop:1103 length:870 start_codon:yes stop_codon:yes gene_type:complete
MCGSSKKSFKVLGQRLNSSQGLNPKKKSGISVSVMKCRKCKLIFSNPRPIPASINDHYNINPDKYWKKEYFNVDENYFLHEIKLAKEFLNFKNGMKALDIGGGIGKANLALTSSGFNTTSIEPSKTFRKLAIEKFNIPENKYLLHSIETADFENNYFDFITFGAVLEHLNDPSYSIIKSMKWLKKGGIVQIEVPSSKHLIAKIYNLFFKLRSTNYVTNLSPMHEPYHLYEFDLKSFEEHSKRNGYEIVHYEYFICSIYNIPTLFHPVLSWIMKITNTGMQLSIWLKKLS